MLLSVRDLQVAFRIGKTAGTVQRAQAVRSIGFDIDENRCLALVGESGSGKSVTALSIVDLLPDNAERRGRILYRGRDLIGASADQMRALRGRDIACVFQDPMSSLNPVLTVGRQVCEPLRTHLRLSAKQARERAAELLAEVGLPEPRRRLDAYAHQLSGGQQQRVMIAMALACEPKLLIADEPTTALDVTIQRQILELLATLRARHRMSLLFISHDLGVVGEIADEVVVMRAGQVREQGPVARLFGAPRDAYTRALLACRPTLQGAPPGRLPMVAAAIDTSAAPATPAGPAGPAGPAPPIGPAAPKDPDAPLILQVRGLAKSYWQRDGLCRRRELPALRDVSFTLRRGHTLGVVGESGSGKTTLGLTLLRLLEPTRGEVWFDGRDLLRVGERERRALRRRLQIVFQNPYASLNPRFTVGQTLLEPMRIHRIGADGAARERRARELLQRVGLDAAAFGRYPHEFSGGQRQRVAIARCLTLQPEVLVLDEAVSALDVSVQAQVLNLLRDLQDELGLAYVFISHDLGVVRFISDEVLVMQDGAVVEQAGAAQLLQAPTQDYTRRLLAAVPRGWQGAVAA